MRRSDERMAKIERSGPYVVRDRIRTIDEMARAVDESRHRRSTASFTSVFVQISEMSTIKHFWLSSLRKQRDVVEMFRIQSYD